MKKFDSVGFVSKLLKSNAVGEKETIYALAVAAVLERGYAKAVKLFPKQVENLKSGGFIKDNSLACDVSGLGIVLAIMGAEGNIKQTFKEARKK
jgi:hypothetical protein